MRASLIVWGEGIIAHGFINLHICERAINAKLSFGAAYAVIQTLYFFGNTLIILTKQVLNHGFHVFSAACLLSKKNSWRVLNLVIFLQCGKHN